MEKYKKNQNAVGQKLHKKLDLLIFALGLMFLLLIIGCTSPSQDNSKTTKPLPSEPVSNKSTSTNTVETPVVPPIVPPAAEACTTKNCFIVSANACDEFSLTLTEEAGVFKYSSSKGCIFTKTLVSLNANETTEMKNLLEGKSFTCKYEKGKFDERWVNSLIFGTEYCEGELRDILAKLIMLT